MSSEATSPLRPPSHPAVVCALLALVTFAVYFPVRNFGFVDYDDSVYFFANPHVLGGLTWSNIQWAFTTGETGNWHPLTWLSLMFDVQLFGNSAAAAHLTNVLLHAANAILVFLLLRRLTGALGRSAVVALFFAVHPMHVESVAWISERKDVLSAFFGLLASFCYARAVSRDSSAPRIFSSSGYWLALLFFVLGLMSKAMLVTLPFVLLLLDFWPLRRFGTLSIPQLLLEKVPFFLLSGLSSVVTFIVQQKSGAVSSLAWVPLQVRVENAFISCLHYVAGIFWPVNLATPYPHTVQWPVWFIALATVLVMALCLLAVVLRKSFPFVFTGWFWFAGMLIPVIGLVQIGMSPMADRYVYLPLIGILLAVVWGTHELFARWQPPRNMVMCATTLLLLACAARAVNQMGVWKNDETLFGHDLAVTENNYIAAIQLATWYAKNGHTQEALECYDNAKRMSPDDLTVRWYSQNDRMQGALSYYFNSLRLNTNDPVQLYNFGNAAAKIGNWDEAIRDYRQALQMNPNEPDTLDNLGLALAHNRQLPEAAACFQAAIRLQPDSINAHNNLAAVLFAQGNFAGAAQESSAALQLSPNDPRICGNLAGVYVRLGQTNLAVKYYQQVLRLQPDNTLARVQLQILGAPPAN